MSAGPWAVLSASPWSVVSASLLRGPLWPWGSGSAASRRPFGSSGALRGAGPRERHPSLRWRRDGGGMHHPPRDPVLLLQGRELVGGDVAPPARRQPF